MTEGTRPDAPIRVLVADDQQVVRGGLVLLIGMLDGIEVVGAARDGAEAVRLAESLRPDVVLMDLNMPVLDGIGATAALRDTVPETAVLVLTTYADDDSVFPALRAGARGYLTKDADDVEVETAIRNVHRGRTWLDPVVQARLVDGVRAEPGPAEARAGAPAYGWRSPGDRGVSEDRGPHQEPRQPEGRRPPGDPREPEGRRPFDRALPDHALSDRALPDGLTPREAEVLTLIAQGLSNTEICERLTVSRATVKTHINRVFAKIGANDRAQAVGYAYRNKLAGGD
ncbi:response regulator [Streptomyces sp. NPDC059477]|uniref:response regulator n=1 Tax=Streptomyces sp. NPDC059477 TaxID=3346847 RepID=UPI0036841B60